jgi:hypothetical protein
MRLQAYPASLSPYAPFTMVSPEIATKPLNQSPAVASAAVNFAL